MYVLFFCESGNVVIFCFKCDLYDTSVSLTEEIVFFPIGGR